MADPDRGPEVDQTSFHNDPVLERELRQALKSEGEIELFKIVNKRIRIEGELENSETVRLMLGHMWGCVADFFELITEAETIAGLQPGDGLVVAHARMRANFDVVATVNATLKVGREAETELRAIDDMGHEAEELL